MLERRAFLSGLAALPLAGAPAALAAAESTTTATASPDAALIAECARVEDLAREEHAAYDRLAELEDNLLELMPYGLTYVDSMPGRPTMQERPAAELRRIINQEWEVGSRTLAEYRERLVRAEAYEAERNALTDRLGINAAVEHAEATDAALIAAGQALAFMPPTTREGLTAKAKAFLTIRRYQGPVSFEWGLDLAEMIIGETVMMGAAT